MYKNKLNIEGHINHIMKVNKNLTIEEFINYYVNDIHNYIIMDKSEKNFIKLYKALINSPMKYVRDLTTENINKYNIFKGIGLKKNFLYNEISLWRIKEGDILLKTFLNSKQGKLIPSSFKNFFLEEKPDFLFHDQTPKYISELKTLLKNLCVNKYQRNKYIKTKKEYGKTIKEREPLLLKEIKYINLLIDDYLNMSDKY